jgi:HEAT repeat protein
MDNHVYALIQQTREKSSDIQKQSAIELGKIDISAYRQEAVDALCALLGSENIEVRETAKDTLVKIGGRDVVEALIPRIASSSTAEVNYAIEILSKIGDAGIDLIIDLLDSKDHDVRKFGCDILGNLKYGESAYDLIELLYDPHINVAIAAGEALGKLGNSEAVPHLIRALQHPDTWMRCIAAEALGKIGDNRAVDAFINMSIDEEPIVLYTIIKAIGNLQDERVVPYIISVLRSNSMFASSAAQTIEHLATVQGDEVYEKLKTAGVALPFIRLLSSDSAEALRSAAHIVGKLQLKEAIQPLTSLLRHENDKIVAEAISALVQIGEPDLTTPVFQQLLSQTTDTTLKDLLQQALYTLQKEQGTR